MIPSPKQLTIALILSANALTGCLPYSQASAPDGPRFDLLYNRQLAKFEHRIDLENHTQTDAWTPVATAWIDFINCRPLAPNTSEQATLPSAVYDSLLLEQARRQRLLVRALITRQKSWGQNTFYAQFYTPGFFDRANPLHNADLIHWPAEHEAWADEVPSSSPTTSQCQTFQQELIETTLDQLTYSPENVYYPHFQQEILATENTLTSAISLTELTPWTRQIRIHAANLHAQAAKLTQDANKSQEHLQNALSHLEILFSTTNPQENGHGQAPQDQENSETNAQAMLLYAILLEQADRSDEAQRLLERAESLGLTDANLWKARYLRLRIFTRAAQWKKAAAIATTLPPATDPTFSAYAYYATQAQDRAGFQDRALALAMAAFRDRPYEADPFLRALYLDNLRRIADYPFETRTLELLEDMGPRNQLFTRVEEFASIALDHGQPDNTAAAANWLLLNQPDARKHPHFNALLALSAFFTQDHAKFDQYITRITARSDALLEAIPEPRRPQFFAAADVELARVFRLMLPAMAEWGESTPAANKRQKWLQTIVTQTQDLLRTSPESTARPALLELYRIASAMLQSHPRGYTENVGDLEPTPLVLGTVHLSERELTQYEPAIEPSFTPLFSLTLIPRDNIAPENWPNSFAPDKTDEEKQP